MNARFLSNPKEYPDYVVPGWKKIKDGEWECIPKPTAEYGKPMYGLTSTLILTDNPTTESEQMLVEFDINEIKVAHLDDLPIVDKDSRGLVLTHYDRDTQATQKTFFAYCGKKSVVIDQSQVYWPEDVRYQQFYFLPALSLSTAKTCRITNLSVAYNDPRNLYWTPVFSHNTYIETPYITDATTAQELKDGKAFYYVTIDFTPEVLKDSTTYLFTFTDDLGFARYIRIDGSDKHLRHNLSPNIQEPETPSVDPDFPVVEPKDHDLGLIEADKDYRFRLKCTHPIAAKITVGMDDKDRHVPASGFAGIIRECTIERVYHDEERTDVPHEHYLDFQVDILVWHPTNPSTHEILEIASNTLIGTLDTVPTTAGAAALWKEYPKPKVSRGVISDNIIYIEG